MTELHPGEKGKTVVTDCENSFCNNSKCKEIFRLRITSLRDLIRVSYNFNRLVQGILFFFQTIIIVFNYHKKYKLLEIELKFITIFHRDKLFDSIVKKITNFPN